MAQRKAQPFNSTRYIRNWCCEVLGLCPFPFFQLHTVHQELANPLTVQCLSLPLSTPHGTLGTGASLGYQDNSGRSCFQLHTVHQELVSVELLIEALKQPFNSTRYIRNIRTNKLPPEVGKISTPHGTLGTGLSFEEVHDFIKTDFNSTRYIRNISLHMRSSQFLFTISTPHGTLGTVVACYTSPTHFHISTPHGTLGTFSSMDLR